MRKSKDSPPAPVAAVARTPLKVVGIGASAGGLEAFTELLQHLPRDASAAFVLVQHLDPTHRSLLSELLSRTTQLPVREIADGDRVEAGHIHVIPPNCNLAIGEGVLHLTPRQKNAGPARSIDRFLASLARDQKENAIGVILSGAGSDGAKGIEAIKKAGGITFAQDEQSSKYDSMPRSAIATGTVDFVLSPRKIAAEITRLLETPGLARSRAAANARRRRNAMGVPVRSADWNSAGTAWPAAPEDLNLRKIFLLLRTKAGIDFSYYRPNTIRRRLNRRLGLAKLRSLEAYLGFLREHPAELEALYQDLLINVTSFFRNPSVFDVLQRKVFPRLVKAHGEGEALRLWVAGCSTGQEAYSLAIAYLEFADKNHVRVPLQIFATDTNATVLETARIGRYTRAQLDGVPAARRQKYFVREADGYRVQKSVRDLVIFAQHNLVTDPPFTRVSLISCRNLLIYFEPAVQQKIIPAFHYALQPDGCLVLGTSETIGPFQKLFEPAFKTHKIYFKKPAAGWLRYERPPAPPTLARSVHSAAPVPAQPEPGPAEAFREADRLTLAKFGPAGVLVNEEGEILQFRGDAQRYLELPTGKATFHLFKLAREGLALPLQRALSRARKEHRPVRERNVRCLPRRDRVDLEVVPLRNLGSRYYLVLFQRVSEARNTPPARVRAAGPRSQDDSRRLTEMRRENLETRASLQSLREEYETTVEELQASNEEVQSANEELQSLNEELETSNEELESANEELTTLNEELATRNAELRESEQRLREKTELLELAPVLARSLKNRIIFWNHGAEKLYGFTADEAVGQIAHLFLGAKFPAPLAAIEREFEANGRWEGEVWHRCKDGRRICVSTQWVMHYEGDGSPRAILEVNTDITARKQAESALRESEEFNRRVLESSPDCITVLDLEGRVVFMSAAGQELMEVGDFSTVAQRHWRTLWEGRERDRAEAALHGALEGELQRFQGMARTLRQQPRWWDVVMRPILSAEGRPHKILAVARDITEHKQAEIAARERARLSTLRADAALVLARGGEVAPVLHEIAGLMQRHLGATLVRIWSVAEDGESFTLRGSAGPAAGPGRDGTARAHEHWLRELVARGIPFTQDLADDERAPTNSRGMGREKSGTVVVLPLLVEAKPYGALELGSRNQLEPPALEEMRLLAEAVAQFVERKQAERERAHLLQEATEARNVALAASRAKDEFIAALSHELRTPLNPVLLLASDGAENQSLPAEVRGVFETIRTNISLEARLIDDLLDLTRIERGKLSLQMKPLDVHAVLRGALGIVAADIEEKRLQVSLALCSERVVVVGDPVRLHQAFWNILINAIKFTPPGGRITLETRLLAGRDHVRIQISDTGQGMTPDELARVFEAFVQGEAKRGGLGLGLAISRRLLDAHGGTIQARSEGRGRGSTFEIELPVTTLPLPAALPVSADGEWAAPTDRRLRTNANGGSDGHGAGHGATGRRRTILLIEDHVPTARTLAGLLSRRAFEVIAVGSAAEAREVLQRRQPDLVISDLGLPDGDGCDLWRSLRRERADLIGIALSGYGMEEDIARSRSAGFAEHLTKPVNIHALDRAIAGLIRNPPNDGATPEPR